MLPDHRNNLYRNDHVTTQRVVPLLQITALRLAGGRGEREIEDPRLKAVTVRTSTQNRCGIKGLSLSILMRADDTKENRVVLRRNPERFQAGHCLVSNMQQLLMLLRARDERWRKDPAYGLRFHARGYE